MAQTAIKIGSMAVQNFHATNLVEIINPEATALDTTVNGVTNNTEVLRVIIADNAVLDADVLAQALQFLRTLASDQQRFNQLIQS